MKLHSKVIVYKRKREVSTIMEDEVLKVLNITKNKGNLSTWENFCFISKTGRDFMVKGS